MTAIASRCHGYNIARSTRRLSARVRHALAAAIAFGLTFATSASPAPPPVVGGPLLDAIESMPAGQWMKVSENLYSDVWTPPALEPLKHLSVSSPFSIIAAWSSFAWDTRRGDLILYGGGHANYSGNDVYRWRSTSMFWERASLPSEITEVYLSNGFMAIDGADAAPAAAHTYDNNNYLPNLDRFLTLGGALYDTGGPYLRPDETTPGKVRTTGPYLFDPNKADGGKVGGTTGSNVKRVAPIMNILGGNMWQNRDLTKNRPLDAKPTKYLDGCTGIAEENGYDVVYIGATSGSGSNLDLYRYVISNVDDPTSDGIAQVGEFWNGTGGQTACGYDASRKLFVLTGSNTVPFVFWSLQSPGPTNRDARVAVNASIAAFMDWLNANSLHVSNCGLAFDPGDGSFAIWCGGPEVWRLQAPATAGATGWSIAMEEPPGGETPPVGWGTGILGKWKHVPGYDVFVGLEDPYAGNVWIYKPVGWTAPQPGDPVNFAPQATLTNPVSGQAFTLGTPINFMATASDSDGWVARVDFEANTERVGSAASAQFNFAWTPASAGSYLVRARAIDNLGGEGLSDVVSISVVAPDIPPTVSLTSPVSGTKYPLGITVPLAATASDADGSVAKMEFFANGQKVGEVTVLPYTLPWTPAAAGDYALTARATDNLGVATDSTSVSITMVAGGGSVTLQQRLNGYTGVVDTMLSSWSPTVNYATAPLLNNYGAQYGDLFRFAVFTAEGGPVPDNAVILSATLQIYKTAYNYVFGLYPMLKPWNASQATWMVASVGNPWTVPGAQGAGTDYAATPDAQFSAPWAPGWMTFDVTNRISTIGQIGGNYGWRIVGISGSSGLIRFYSSEYPNALLGPQLTVTWLPPGS